MSESTTRPEGAHGPGAPDVSGPTEPDAIRADIEATRDQLAATVDELSHRLDVNGQVSPFGPSLAFREQRPSAGEDQY